MNLPPLNFQTSSSASGQASAGFDNSGFVVQYGNGNAASATGGGPGGLPSWVYIAGAVLLGVWYARRG